MKSDNWNELFQLKQKNIYTVNTVWLNCHLQFLFYCFHMKSNKISVKMSIRVGIYVFARDNAINVFIRFSCSLSRALSLCIYSHTCMCMVCCCSIHPPIRILERVCHKLVYFGLDWVEIWRDFKSHWHSRFHMNNFFFAVVLCVNAINFAWKLGWINFSRFFSFINLLYASVHNPQAKKSE